MFSPPSWDEYISLSMISYSVHSYMYLYFYFIQRTDWERIYDFIVHAQGFSSQFVVHIHQGILKFIFLMTLVFCNKPYIIFSLQCRDKSEWVKYVLLVDLRIFKKSQKHLTSYFIISYLILMVTYTFYQCPHLENKGDNSNNLYSQR